MAPRTNYQTMKIVPLLTLFCSRYSATVDPCPEKHLPHRVVLSFKIIWTFGGICIRDIPSGVRHDRETSYLVSAPLSGRLILSRAVDPARNSAKHHVMFAQKCGCTLCVDLIRHVVYVCRSEEAYVRYNRQQQHAINRLCYGKHIKSLTVEHVSRIQHCTSWFLN